MQLTPQGTLGTWLIIVLGEHGGRARKARALQLMEQRFGSLLTDDDRLPQPSNAELKWENQTAWQRNDLVKTGLLQPVDEAGHGVWALTERGWAHYRSLTNHGVAERGSNTAAAKNPDRAKGSGAREPMECSRCGRVATSLVTLGPSSQAPGRLLSYCSICRAETASSLEVVLPLSLFDQDPQGTLLRLYRAGLTRTDPDLVANHLRLPPSGAWYSVARTACR